MPLKDQQDGQHDIHAGLQGFEEGAFHRQLFESAPAPLLVVDADTYGIVAVNDAYLDAVAAQRHDLLGKHIFEAFPDPDPEIHTGTRNIGAAIERVKRSGEIDVMPVQHYPVPVAGDGFEDRYWSPVHAPVFDAEGRVRYIIQRPENVTELVHLQDHARRNAEDRHALAERGRQMEMDILLRSAELQRINEHLRLAQRVALIGSWEYRPDAAEVKCSEEVYRILGFKHEPHKRPSPEWLLDVACEDDKPKVRALQDALLRGETVAPVTFRLCQSHAGERHVEVRAECGQVDSEPEKVIYGTLQDITEQKTIEAALRQSEERFRLVAKATADTIFDWNIQKDTVWWNEGLQKIFGHEPAEHGDTKSFWTRLIHPADRDRVQTSLERAFERGDEEWHEEYRFLRTNGESAVVTVRAFLMQAEGRVTRVLGSLNDVTLQRRYEHKLREQAELLDKARDAIIVHDLDGRIRYWSKGAERLYQWHADEVTGKSVAELLSKDPGVFAEVVNATVEDGEWNGRIIQQCRDGTVLTVEGAWSLVTNEAGEPDAILAINTNVTDRLRLEEQLRQAQRLEAVGQLTGGIAHDFNNLLTVILGNAELVLEPGMLEREFRELVTLIRDTAQRGSDLTQRLLAFARQQYLQPRIVNANALLHEMETLLRRTLLGQLEVEIKRERGLWETYVDPAQLEAALLNLAINARDAMPNGGRLIMETANVELDGGGGPHDVPPGKYVSITVSDTGTGIDPEHIDKVFDPFFTTKEKGKGTGLGLSMTYGFMKQSRGHITIESEIGKGTTVRMYLPRMTEAVGINLERPETMGDEPRGDECILVVEDDEQVRRLAVRNLERLGYEVLAAADGFSALDLIRENPSIDLLFTDVIMTGGMNGRELALLAQEHRPGLPVLYVSGYTEKVLMQRQGLDTENEIDLLQKPYGRAELARRIRRALKRDRRRGVSRH